MFYDHEVLTSLREVHNALCEHDETEEPPNWDLNVQTLKQVVLLQFLPKIVRKKQTQKSFSSLEDERCIVCVMSATCMTLL